MRNLRLGLATAARFGGSMPVGYLPDMFGHVAQMPQILAGFGMTDAVVWRGVPAAVEASAFWWEAPDGTQVRAEYLPDGYGNGARMPEHGKELLEKIDAFRDAQGNKVGDSILWMNGTDHLLPQAHLGRVVAEANEASDAYRIEVTSLAAHIAAGPRDGLPTWEGELRSGARSNLLMGVASCRVDVKQAAARAERWLERVAEPLATCWQPADAYPAAFLAHAWRDVIRNAAHDTICGCSADEVNDAVLHRYAESTRVAEAIADRARIRVLAASAQPAVAINPTSRTRAGVVRAVIAGDVAPPHTQQLSVRDAVDRTHTVTRTTAIPVVQRLIVDDPKVSSVEVVEHPDGTVVATFQADSGPKLQDMTALRVQLEALAAADPEGPVHLDIARTRATQEVLLRTDPVPGFGWRGLAPADLGDHAVRSTGQGITNGLVTIIPDQGDGTFSVNGIAGLGRIVDDGDEGDTYNWSPPAFDGEISRPHHVDVLVSEAGPVRGRIDITRQYRWPTRIEHGRRVGPIDVFTYTRVELRAGEDLVRVTVRFHNPSTDHRVRMWFPLPEPAATSEAECAFGTVTRGLTAEGGPNEIGLPTFPSRRFVSAGGLTVAHDGPVRVRAGRHRGRRRCRPGLVGGHHAAALRGPDLRRPHGHASAARRSAHAHPRRPDAGPPPGRPGPARGWPRPVRGGRRRLHPAAHRPLPGQGRAGRPHRVGVCTAGGRRRGLGAHPSRRRPHGAAGGQHHRCAHHAHRGRPHRRAHRPEGRPHRRTLRRLPRPAPTPDRHPRPGRLTAPETGPAQGSMRCTLGTRSIARSNDTIPSAPATSAWATRYASAKSSRSSS